MTRYILKKDEERRFRRLLKKRGLEILGLEIFIEPLIPKIGFITIKGEGYEYQLEINEVPT